MFQTVASPQGMTPAEWDRLESLPLNGNQGFSLLKSTPTPAPAQPAQKQKPAPVTLRGYDIRIQRDGSTWLNEKAHGYAPAGQLPAEWITVCKDPSVVKAVIFPSNQRTWRADRRKHLATFERTEVVVVA